MNEGKSELRKPAGVYSLNYVSEKDSGRFCCHQVAENSDKMFVRIHVRKVQTTLASIYCRPTSEGEGGRYQSECWWDVAGQRNPLMTRQLNVLDVN